MVSDDNPQPPGAASRALESGIEPHFDVDAGAPVQPRGDPQRRQVLLNLVGTGPGPAIATRAERVARQPIPEIG